MWIDIEITPDLREKGMMREFTRGVQEARKNAGLKPQDRITLEVYFEDKNLEDFFEHFGAEIVHAVHADSLVFTDEHGEHEIVLGEYKVVVSVIPKL